MLTITFAGVSSTGTPAAIVAAILANAAALQAAGISSSGSPITAANVGWSAGLLNWTNLSKNFGNENAANTEFVITGQIDFNGQTGSDSDTIPILNVAFFDNSTKTRDLSQLPNLDMFTSGGIAEVSPTLTTLTQIESFLAKAFFCSVECYALGRSVPNSNATSDPAQQDFTFYQYTNSDNGIVAVSEVVTVASDPAASGLPNAVNAAQSDFVLTQGGAPTALQTAITNAGLEFCAGYRWTNSVPEGKLPLNLWLSGDANEWVRIKTVILPSMRR